MPSTRLWCATVLAAILGLTGAVAQPDRAAAQSESAVTLEGTAVVTVVDTFEAGQADFETTAILTAEGDLYSLGQLPANQALPNGAEVTAQVVLDGIGPQAAVVDVRNTNVLGVAPFTLPTEEDFHHVFDIAVMTPQAGQVWPETDPEITAWLELVESYYTAQTGYEFDFTVGGIKRGVTSETNPGSGYEQVWDDAALLFGHTKPRQPDQGWQAWYLGEPRHHLLVFIPTAYFPATGFAGLANLGAGLSSGGVIMINPSNNIYWVNASGSVGSTYVEAMVHEVGHNLGLAHANRISSCTTNPGGGAPYVWDENQYAGCTVVEYADRHSVMGIGSSFLINPAMRYQWGLLDEDQLTVIDTAVTNQTVTLHPGQAADGAVAVVVSDPAGKQDYILEYRTYNAGSGYGANWGGDGLRVVKLLQSRATVEFNPTMSDYDVPLGVGQTFTSAGSRISVTVVSQTAAELVLSVTRADAGTAGPTLSVSPGSAVVQAEGGEVVISAATNQAWLDVRASASWIKPVGGTAGYWYGDGRIYHAIEVDANLGSQRQGTVTVTAAVGASQVSRTLTLTQRAAGSQAYSYALPSLVSLGAAAGSQAQVVLTVTGPWSVSSAPQWVSVSPASGGAGTTTVTV
ncbi:MAG: hypothetical protein LBR19_01230, partial [Bifidobacteriaceae bacterium]|nr:hypothetical protein [Bifidobacteriaceae bacterium]